MPQLSLKDARAVETAAIQGGLSGNDAENIINSANQGRSINSQSLSQQPSFNLTQPEPATEAAGMLGYLDAFSQNAQAQAQQRQSTKDDALGQYLKAELSGNTEAGLTDQLYSQNVDPLEQELNDINSQIAAEQHALRRRVEAIQKNSNGLLESQVNNRIQEAERDSLGKQADLAIIQMSKQGRYDSAKAIADRAVAAMYEKQEKRNAALKYNYEQHKDLFDTSEQRAFELAQGDRERRLEEEKAQRMALFNQRIDQQNAAFSHNLDNSGGSSDTDVMAYTQALQSGTATLAQVPQKLRGQVLKSVQDSGTNKLLGLLGQYRDTVKGTNFFTANMPSKRALIDTLKGQITAVYKQQQQLGTLDNGVQRLVDKIIPDPSNLSISSLNNDAQVAAIDNFISNQTAADPLAAPTQQGDTDDPLGLGI